MFDDLTTHIPAAWRELLSPQISEFGLHELNAFLSARLLDGVEIYPPVNEVFTALKLTPPDGVKVVILGQDPYPGVDQAHGLAFSVKKGQAIPKSLRNIFTELNADLGLPMPQYGDLSHWARQGVLLLNTVLTVEAGAPASHRGKGWETLTHTLLDGLNDMPQSIIFCLWGAHAHAFEALITRPQHTVLRAPHPSPLSAYRGFFGCRHFSQINAHLKACGQTPIDWSL